MGLFRRSSGSLDCASSSSHAASSPGHVQALGQLHSCKFKTSLQGNTACLSMAAEASVSPDVMFALLANPAQHESIFDAIEGASCSLVEEEGPRRRFKLDYRARWRFWRVSGVCDNRLWMDTDSDAGTVSFVLREPGFLKVYEGVWRITPAGASSLNLHSRLHSPATASPFPSPSRTTTHHHHSMSDPGAAGTYSHSGSGNHSVDGNALSDPGLGSCAGSYNASQGALFGMTSLLASISSISPLTHITSRLGLMQDSSSASLSPSPSSQSLSSTTTSGSMTSGELTTGVVPHTVPARCSIVVDRLVMSPKLSPPYPLSQTLKGHAIGQVQDMLDGLLRAARSLTPDDVSRLTRDAVTSSSFPTPITTSSSAVNLPASKHSQEMSRPDADSQHLRCGHAQEHQGHSPLFARIFLGHGGKGTSVGRALLGSYAINVADYMSDDE